MKTDIYSRLMEIGRSSGCHQLPERSFFVKGKQMPVCARCFGAFVGYIAGIVLYHFYKLPLYAIVLLCAIMFFDWFIQRVGLKESTNIRRFITGILCGAALCHLYVGLIVNIIKYAIKMIM